MLITFDIGGTSIKYGIFTIRKGQPVFVMQNEISSDARVLKGPGILQRVETLIAKAMQQQDIEGIAISTAGMVDAEKGCIQYANDNIDVYKRQGLSDDNAAAGGKHAREKHLFTDKAGTAVFS